MRRSRHLPWGLGAAILACASGAVVGTTIGVAAGAALAAVAATSLVAFARVSLAHIALTRHLRDRSVPHDVAGTHLRVGHLGGSAFVAGLARPAIFCDRDLLRDLDPAEVRAVVLHERAHQLARDPFRNAIVASVTPMLSRTQRGRLWLERRAAGREIAADQYALNQGVDPRSIASALIKVPPTGPLYAAAFTPAVELRLCALLGDNVELPHEGPPWRAVATGAMVGLALCVTMAGSTLGIIQAMWCCTG